MADSPCAGGGDGAELVLPCIHVQSPSPCVMSTALVLRDAADGLSGFSEHEGRGRQRKKPAVFNPDFDGLSDRQKLQRLQDGKPSGRVTATPKSERQPSEGRVAPIARSSSAPRPSCTLPVVENPGKTQPLSCSGDTEWARDLEARPAIADRES